MIQVTSSDKSNKAGDKDWREVSKGLIITAHEPYARPDTKQGQTLTKVYSEHDSSKASRRIK
jgi:hypothetical protein